MERTKPPILIPNVDISVKDVGKAMRKIINRIQGTILTNDPSMTAWGWAIITYSGQILKSGCIKTETEGKKRRIRKSDETSQRISEINNILIGLIKENNVNLILSEAPHGSQNASAAVMIGAVAAIVQTISDCFGLAVEFYSEQDSKKCLLGKKSATKQETIDAIQKIYGGKFFTGIKYKDEAIADAIAVYHVASKQSTAIKIFKK